MARSISFQQRIGFALFMSLALAIAAPSQAQVSRWADPGDLNAKVLIELERKWADSGCTHNGIEQVILAEDFQGISPEGKPYSK